MTQPFDPPGASAPQSVFTTVLLALCTSLGVLGLLATFSGAFSLASTHFATFSPEQAELVEEIRAAQPGWLLPVTVVSLVLKLVLSLGLVVGGGLTLADHPSGRRILVPTLVYGVIFEIAYGLFGLVNTVAQKEAMTDQFGRAMQLDPGVPAEVAETAGTAFGVLMVLTMALIFGWALLKAALYEGTRRRLAKSAS